ENAVGTISIACDFVGGGRVYGQRAIREIERSKAAGHRTKPPLEGVSTRGVDDQDLNAGTFLIHLAQYRVDAGAIPADFGLGPNLRIGRNKVALFGNLDAKSAEEEQRGRSLLDFGHESIDRLLGVGLAQIVLDLDVKPKALQFIAKRTRILDRR